MLKSAFLLHQISIGIQLLVLSYVYFQLIELLCYAMPSIRSLICFGRNTHTVPMTAIIEQTTIKNQFRTFSFMPISLPNSFRWNDNGRTIHMLNAIAEPMRAMIMSNEGTRIAIKMMTPMVKTRIPTLRDPRV